jgi:hypothetical protein
LSAVNGNTTPIRRSALPEKIGKCADVGEGRKKIASQILQTPHFRYLRFVLHEFIVAARLPA